MPGLKRKIKNCLLFCSFESQDVPNYINQVKNKTDEEFLLINKSNIYFIKKSVRKILRNINKQIRFSMSKEVEAELLIHFCNCMVNYAIPIKKSRQLQNLFDSQLKKSQIALSSLHPDLQYDLKKQMLFTT